MNDNTNTETAMHIEISPDALFTFSQVDAMLGLNKERTRTLVQNGKLAGLVVKKGERLFIRAADFDKVRRAHQTTRSLNRKNPLVTVRRSEWNELVERVRLLEERYEELATAPDPRAPFYEETSDRSIPALPELAA